jgi:Autographa californica nuclear polyhedrosis virus (AcMNPV) protein
MSCPFNIKVIISERFFVFPYEYVVAQNDVGNAPVHQLVVYVPTLDDVQYVNKEKLGAQFDSVLVYHHEASERVDSRTPKKNATATVVYWNPVMPITEVGVGETRVFSILLTNSLFYCNTMILDSQTPLCPIEFNREIRYDTFIPIAGEVPLFYSEKLFNDNVNDFLICFNLETSIAVKILNVKRLISMMSFRRVPARYAINLPDAEIDTIYSKLQWERSRRLMKGDNNESGCSHINREALNFMQRAQELLGVKDYSRSVHDMVARFQPIIVPFQVVPDIIVKLNTLEREKHVRLYCKNDSFAITSFGPVPNNMPDDSPHKFDYSNINNNNHLFDVSRRVAQESDIDDLKITAARYNYFF